MLKTQVLNVEKKVELKKIDKKQKKEQPTLVLINLDKKYFLEELNIVLERVEINRVYRICYTKLKIRGIRCFCWMKENPNYDEQIEMNGVIHKAALLKENLRDWKVITTQTNGSKKKGTHLTPR